MNIDISPQGMQFIDTVIVSFIIMKEKDRQSQDQPIATTIIFSNAQTIASSS
jgi:hypothetical protein